MSKSKEFLDIHNLLGLLAGGQQSSLYKIVDFMSWLALLMFALWALSWAPPLRNLISSIRSDIYCEFSKSDIIADLIPNFQRRCRYYKIIVWAMLGAMAVCYLMSLGYGSCAFSALISDTHSNKLGSFALLAGLSAAMFFVGQYLMREANRWATCLQRVIF